MAYNLYSYIFDALYMRVGANIADSIFDDCQLLLGLDPGGLVWAYSMRETQTSVLCFRTQKEYLTRSFVHPRSLTLFCVFLPLYYLYTYNILSYPLHLCT